MRTAEADCRKSAMMKGKILLGKKEHTENPFAAIETYISSRFEFQFCDQNIQDANDELNSIHRDIGGQINVLKSTRAHGCYELVIEFVRNGVSAVQNYGLY